MLGITFFKENLEDGRHTFKTLGLKWVEPYEIPMPEPKTHKVDIPGADGQLDLTESLDSFVRYGNRAGVKLEFEVPDQDYFEFEKIKSDLSNYLHGQRMKMALDTDDRYYYVGRFELDHSKTSKANSTIVISANLEPYKYELYSQLGDWLWDTFNFEVGDIRDQREVIINGEWNIKIPPTRIPTVPTFTIAVEEGETLSVEFKGIITENLQNGTYEIPGIEFGNFNSTMLFKGKGVVTVHYIEGSL